MAVSGEPLFSAPHTRVLRTVANVHSEHPAASYDANLVTLLSSFQCLSAVTSRKLRAAESG